MTLIARMEPFVVTELRELMELARNRSNADVKLTMIVKTVSYVAMELAKNLKIALAKSLKIVKVA